MPAFTLMFSEPAATAAADVVRVFLIAGSGVMFTSGVAILVQSRGMTRYQKARFLALLAGCGSVAYTAVDRIGHPATFRLAMNTAFVVLGLYGVSGLILHRRRAPSAQPAEEE